MKLTLKKAAMKIPGVTKKAAPGHNMHFAKMAKDMAPKASLKYQLHKHLTGHEPERPLSNIHASDMTKDGGICPRFYALHDVIDMKPRDRWMDAASAVTFRMGNDLQSQLVEYFADMGRLIGDWECLACATMFWFQHRPKACSCGCKKFAAHEVRFKSAVTGASCGVDMLVDLGLPKLMPVEVKTMIKTEFENLAAPLSEHRLRTNLYLRIIEESEHEGASLVDTQNAKVLYVCKGGYKSDPELKKWGLTDLYSPFKEYDVKRNDKATDEMANRAKVVTDFRAGKIGMPCGVCQTAMDKRAGTCTMKKYCFSGEHPPEHDWS